jgi:hypothetical protein
MEEFQMYMVGFFSCGALFCAREGEWGLTIWYAGLAIMNLILALT